MCNTGCILPKPGYLEAMRELATRHGIVLIFDEVITGFRLGLGGAQGVSPFGRICRCSPKVLAAASRWRRLAADGRL